MIHLYIGTNTQKAIEEIRATYTGFESVYVDCLGTDEESLQAVISGQSLFGTKRCIVVNGVYTQFGAEAFELSLQLAHTSMDSFLFIEDKLLKKQKDLATSYGVIIVEEKKQDIPKDNRIYTAIQTRDKKLAWIALSHLYTIDTPEYAHGAIYTAYKSLLEASLANRLGLVREDTSFSSDWIFQKSIQASKLYTMTELETCVLILARMLQIGHGEAGEKLESLLERFVLERV